MLMEIGPIRSKLLGWSLQFGINIAPGNDRISTCHSPSRQFVDEQAAWDFVQALEGTAVIVRYKRDHPEISALRVSDQMPTFNQAEASFWSQLWMLLKRN